MVFIVSFKWFMVYYGFQYHSLLMFSFIYMFYGLLWLLIRVYYG